MGAESQNTGYEGRVGFEKKIHKTHFSGADRKLKKSKKSKWVWVEYQVGKFIRVKQENKNE